MAFRTDARIRVRRCVVAGGLARAAAALMVSLACATAAHAQSASIYQEQGQLVRASENIATLGADLFGDKANLYAGSLEFVQTDVSVPGNNALPVAIGRRCVAGRHPTIRGTFGDWDLEIPRLEASRPPSTSLALVFKSAAAVSEQRMRRVGLWESDRQPSRLATPSRTIEVTR